ncbi:MAG: PEGA domain-containing protein [Chitinivibrionales bacterium]|nr:PEGA domain-containing protein [Chitinivibrionales bacterium]
MAFRFAALLFAITMSVSYAQQEQRQVEAPEAEEMAEEAATIGDLQIVTDPDSAVLIVGGVNYGKTPLRIEGFEEGMYEVVLKKRGHYLKKARVPVKAGRVNEYEFKLLKPARLVVVTQPENASIVLSDGGKAKKAASPYTTESLKPGTYSLIIEKEGYEFIERSIRMQSGGKDSLYFALTRVAQKPQEAAQQQTGEKIKPVKKTPAKTPSQKPQEEKAAAPEKKEKSKKDMSVGRIVVLGIFALFGVGILIAELTGS